MIRREGGLVALAVVTSSERVNQRRRVRLFSSRLKKEKTVSRPLSTPIRSATNSVPPRGRRNGEIMWARAHVA